MDLDVFIASQTYLRLALLFIIIIAIVHLVGYWRAYQNKYSVKFRITESIIAFAAAIILAIYFGLHFNEFSRYAQDNLAMVITYGVYILVFIIWGIRLVWDAKHKR